MNDGFIISFFSREKGLYYWDASCDFECSNEMSNAYYIADSMAKLFAMANIDDNEYMSVKYLSALKRFSLWKKCVYRRFLCSKKLRELDADFLQQKRHKGNMFAKFEDTFTYDRKHSESFVSALCGEEDIKRYKEQFEITKKVNRSSREILGIISELDDFFFLDQPEEEIEKAEYELGLTFAEEYKDYVRTGGAICGGGIELTGITDFERLNVVAVTKKERALNPFIPDNMYVVEVVGIDRMVVLQDEAGVIYTAQPGLSPEKFFNSLYEYIKNVGRFSPNENARSGFYYDNCDEFGQDLFERIENGLIPILPSGKMIHLHHMGLSQKMPIDISPLVEFESEYYAQPKVFNSLFLEFDGETNYDRLTSIKQKQKHWNKRSESNEISFNI